MDSKQLVQKNKHTNLWVSEIDHERVFIKTTNFSTQREILLGEMRILESLNANCSSHLIWCFLFQLPEEEGQPLANVYKFVPGMFAVQLVANNNLTTVQQALLAKDLFAAVQFIHEQDFVHSNINVNNVIMDTKSNHATLINFDFSPNGAILEKHMFQLYLEQDVIDAAVVMLQVMLHKADADDVKEWATQATHNTNPLQAILVHAMMDTPVPKASTVLDIIETYLSDVLSIPLQYDVPDNWSMGNHQVDIRIETFPIQPALPLCYAQGGWLYPEELFRTEWKHVKDIIATNIKTDRLRYDLRIYYSNDQLANDLRHHFVDFYPQDKRVIAGTLIPIVTRSEQFEMSINDLVSLDGNYGVVYGVTLLPTTTARAFILKLSIQRNNNLNINEIFLQSVLHCLVNSKDVSGNPNPIPPILLPVAIHSVRFSSIIHFGGVMPDVGITLTEYMLHSGATAKDCFLTMAMVATHLHNLWNMACFRHNDFHPGNVMIGKSTPYTFTLLTGKTVNTNTYVSIIDFGFSTWVSEQDQFDDHCQHSRKASDLFMLLGTLVAKAHDNKFQSPFVTAMTQLLVDSFVKHGYTNKKFWVKHMGSSSFPTIFFHSKEIKLTTPQFITQWCLDNIDKMES